MKRTVSRAKIKKIVKMHDKNIRIHNKADILVGKVAHWRQKLGNLCMSDNTSVYVSK